MAAEEYVLGEDVTSRAKSKTRKDTVVLSIRLSIEELSEIEAAGEATGKTVSQVVREAIRNCLHSMRQSQPAVTVSSGSGFTFSTGYQGPSGKAEIVPTAAQVANQEPVTG